MLPFPDGVLKDLSTLEGLISDAVGLRLATLASFVSPASCVVEIGSFKGKSACYLGWGSRLGNGAPVFAIEPWDLPGNTTGRHGFANSETRRAFHRQVDAMGLGAEVTALRAFARDLAPAWSRPIGLLYIDGSHTEEDVQQDWDLWSPYLAPGAFVAFDDYNTPRNPGVAKVVDRLRSNPRLSWEAGPEPLIIAKLHE